MKHRIPTRWVVVAFVLVVAIAAAICIPAIPRWHETTPASWVVSDDEAVLTVWIIGGWDDIAKAELLDQAGTTVQVTGFTKYPHFGFSQARPAVGACLSVDLRLDQPLGSRPVVDRDNNPIPGRGNPCQP